MLVNFRSILIKEISTKVLESISLYAVKSSCQRRQASCEIGKIKATMLYYTKWKHFVRIILQVLINQNFFRFILVQCQEFQCEKQCLLGLQRRDNLYLGSKILNDNPNMYQILPTKNLKNCRHHQQDTKIHVKIAIYFIKREHSSEILP